VTGSSSLKCWGRNAEGRIGDGTTTQRLAPTDVNGLTSGVSAVRNGVTHSCALTSSGGLKCWGNNNGQLGDGTTIDRLTPTDVVGLASGANAIALGYISHSCALTNTGTIRCWGDNDEGQLGDNTTTERLTSVAAGGGWTATIYKSATLTTAALATGEHSLTALYGGDDAHDDSMSSSSTHTTGVAATSTAVSSSDSATNPGQSVTFTATVAALAPGGGMPTGNVTFKRGSVPLATRTLSSGSARLSRRRRSKSAATR
jgi:hypothetical protein